MPRERADSSQISTEVVGVISDTQKAELNRLGFEILEALGIQTDDEDGKSQVKLVLEDCVFRGLKIRGREWFKKDESVVPFFEAGLLERRGVVEKLKSLSHELEFYFKYSIPDSEKYLDDLNAFDPNIEKAETIIVELTTAKRTITQFQDAVLTQPQIAKDINNITSDLNNAENLNSIEVINALIANVLLNLGLYKSLSVSVDPEDVVALREIWSKPEDREASQSEIISKFMEYANNHGMDMNMIKVYLEKIFIGINLMCRDSQITTDDLRLQTVFALKGTQLLETELSQTQKRKEKTFAISQDDLTNSYQKVQEIEALIRMIGQRNSINQETDQYIQEKYNPVLMSLGGLEVGIIYTQSFTEEWGNRTEDELEKNYFNYIREDLFEFINPESLIDLYKLIHADKIIDLETGEKVNLWNLPTIEDLKKTVNEAIIQMFLNKDISHEVKSIVFTTINPSTKAILLSNISSDNMSVAEKDIIFSMSQEELVELATQLEVIAQSDPNGNLELIYTSGSEFLKPIIDNLNESKRTKLITTLANIITF